MAKASHKATCKRNFDCRAFAKWLNARKSFPKIRWQKIKYGSKQSTIRLGETKKTKKYGSLLVECYIHRAKRRTTYFFEARGPMMVAAICAHKAGKPPGKWVPAEPNSF